MTHDTDEGGGIRLPCTSFGAPGIFHDDGDLLLNTIHVAVAFYAGGEDVLDTSADTRGMDPVMVGEFGAGASDSQEVLVNHTRGETDGEETREKVRTCLDYKHLALSRNMAVVVRRLGSEENGVDENMRLVVQISARMKKKTSSRFC